MVGAATVLTPGPAVRSGRERRLRAWTLVVVVAIYSTHGLAGALREEGRLVAVFIHEALKERARQGRPVPATALVAVVGASAVGIIDECIPAFIPSRVFDPEDILFNILAATMAVASSVALWWARRRAASR